MAGKKNPNLGDKLRQEREGAENTLRDSRSKTADSSTGDGGKKKAEHRRQIRHEADLAKMRSKKLKSEQEVKAKKNAAASGKKAESQRSREILRQMHFQPRHIRVCAMPTRIIILVWRQRILPKAQRKVQPVLVPGSNMVESCGSTKSWSGWRKRQIKMPQIPSLRNA